MTENERKPWDKWPVEPDEAYARFLVYRNLGPSRSLDSAYAIHSGAPKGTKRHQAPGQWKEDSTSYEWVSRAHAWDVAQLSEQGAAAVVNFVALLNAVTVRALEALADEKKRPRSFAAVVSTLETIGTLIPEEAIPAVTGDDGSPRLGTRAQGPDTAVSVSVTAGDPNVDAPAGPAEGGV